MYWEHRVSEISCRSSHYCFWEGESVTVSVVLLPFGAQLPQHGTVTICVRYPWKKEPIQHPFLPSCMGMSPIWLKHVFLWDDNTTDGITASQEQ